MGGSGWNGENSMGGSGGSGGSGDDIVLDGTGSDDDYGNGTNGTNGTFCDNGNDFDPSIFIDRHCTDPGDIVDAAECEQAGYKMEDRTCADFKGYMETGDNMMAAPDWDGVQPEWYAGVVTMLQDNCCSGPIDCFSADASECERRCTKCIGAGDGDKDADGNDCSDCGVCSKYVKCAGGGSGSSESGSGSESGGGSCGYDAVVEECKKKRGAYSWTCTSEWREAEVCASCKEDVRRLEAEKERLEQQLRQQNGGGYNSPSPSYYPSPSPSYYDYYSPSPSYYPSYSPSPSYYPSYSPSPSYYDYYSPSPSYYGGGSYSPSPSYYDNSYYSPSPSYNGYGSLSPSPGSWSPSPGTDNTYYYTPTPSPYSGYP